MSPDWTRASGLTRFSSCSRSSRSASSRCCAGSGSSGSEWPRTCCSIRFGSSRPSCGIRRTDGPSRWLHSTRAGGSTRCSTTPTSRPARASGLSAWSPSRGSTGSVRGRRYANSWSTAFSPERLAKSTLNKVNAARGGNFVPVAFINPPPHVVVMAAAHLNRRPLLALVLLSPVIAEMLSGSTPPFEWLNPIAVLFLIWLYGAGVLVMRETAVRWKTGWPSILLLGAAYGIIEEGLAVKSFFDPGWMDLGTLGWYGRWLDVNWVWAVWLTIYHAVVSIAIPIFLVEWLSPRTRGQPLTSRRGYVMSIALLAGATVFINILLTPYRPSAWHLLGAGAAVALLVWAAKKYAGVLWARLPSRKDPRSPRVYALAGFGFLMGSFLLYGGGPFFGVIPAITILEGAAVLMGVILLVRRTSDDPARWARQRFAFVAGAMGFLIVLAAFLEIAGWRGMAIVGAAFAFLLVRLYRKSSPTTEVRAVVPSGPAAP